MLLALTINPTLTCFRSPCLSFGARLCLNLTVFFSIHIWDRIFLIHPQGNKCLSLYFKRESLFVLSLRERKFLWPYQTRCAHTQGDFRPCHPPVSILRKYRTPSQRVFAACFFIMTNTFFRCQLCWSIFNLHQHSAFEEGSQSHLAETNICTKLPHYCLLNLLFFKISLKTLLWFGWSPTKIISL